MQCFPLAFIKPFYFTNTHIISSKKSKYFSQLCHLHYLKVVYGSVRFDQSSPLL